MKKCPYCAEEIQDAAVVCKHCGRDLKGGASQVQLVAPKKKTGVAAWGCLTLIILFVLASIIGQCGVRRPPASATASPPAGPVAAAAATTPPAKTTKWLRAEETSKIDDSKTVEYSIVAENEVTGWLAHERPTLVARCSEGKLAAFVITGMPANPELGEFHRYTVKVRFDDKPAQSQMWSQSTDDKALFAPSPSAILTATASATRLRFIFTPFRSDPQIAEFAIAGFQEPLKELTTTCKTRRK